MPSDLDALKVVVADNSIIVRSGMVTVLKRIPGLKVTPFEVSTNESLHNYVLMHSPRIVVVNPTFNGYFDIKAYRESKRTASVKYVAMLSSVIDKSLLKDYDDSFSIYDDIGEISDKLKSLAKANKADQAEGHDSLSDREKEIVVCVVKGMTNKEIADKLCLSIHTVITHRRNISHKLQIHSPAGLTIYAIVNKLIELRDIKDPL